MMKFGLLDRSIRLLAPVRPGFQPAWSGAMGQATYLVGGVRLTTSKSVSYPRSDSISKLYGRFGGLLY